MTDEELVLKIYNRARYGPDGPKEVELLVKELRRQEAIIEVFEDVFEGKVSWVDAVPHPARAYIQMEIAKRGLQNQIFPPPENEEIVPSEDGLTYATLPATPRRDR